MRRALIYCLLFSLLALPRAAAPGLVIPEGTPVLLVTEERMVSGETPEHSVVLYRVDRDVLGPQGQVLIPKGARAHGKVLKSEGSGFFGQAGTLNLSIDTVEGADKTVIPLRAVKDATADDSTAGMIVGAVLLSVFFVFMEGDDVTIPAGTIFSGYVNRDTSIPAPLPPRGKLESRSAVLSKPAAGATMQKEDQMIFACTTTPADPEAYVRLYVDNTVVAGQKGSLERVVWDTRINEKLMEKLCSEGQHTVLAEVTFANGQLVRSAPVSFVIKD